MTVAGEHAFRATVLAALVACLVGTVVAIGENAAPAWNGAPLVVLCGLTAVEAYAAHRLLHWGSGGSTLAHIAGFIVVAQLCVDALEGRAPIQGGQPYLNGRLFIYFLPVFLTWLAVTEVMRPLSLLDRAPDAGFLDESPVRRLTVYFFIAGTALFIAAGLTQPAVASMLKFPHPGTGAPLLPVLAYFVLGIVFLGRMEYATLRHRWQVQRTVIAAGMGARWTLTVAVFTAAVLALAFLLPTSRTLGVLGPAHAAWDQAVWLLRGPLSSLIGYFHPTTPTRIDPRLKPPPGFHLPPRRPALPHSGAGHGTNWLALLETLVFWIGAVLVVGYLVRLYVRHRRARIRQPRLRHLPGPWGAIARFWAGLFGRLRGLLSAIADRLPESVSARLPVPRARALRTSAGGPIGGPTRQQILAYYRRMVRQAQRRGIARAPAQTPEEFAATLAREVPQAGGDVAYLTSAYVEARYSRHDLPSEGLAAVRAAWERIRHALRALRR